MTLDDKATEREEQHREWALHEHARHAAAHKLKPTGECLTCGDPELPEGFVLFCSPECMKDWERKERARRIAGAR